MFKFIVIAAIVAVATAKPGVLRAAPSLIEVRTPTIARVGSYVESIPAAISHQRSTIVHARSPIITPIIAPAIRTSIATPFVRSWAPELRSYAVAGPVLRTAPLLKTYAAAPALTYGSPLLRSW